MADNESTPTGNEEQASEGSTLESVAKIGGVALGVGAAVAGGVLAGQRLFSGRGGDESESDGDAAEADPEPTGDVSDGPDPEGAGEADVAAGAEHDPGAATDDRGTNEPGDEEPAAAEADSEAEADVDAEEDEGPVAAEADSETEADVDAEKDRGPQAGTDVGSADDGDDDESIASISSTLKEAAVAAAVAGARAASEVFTDRTGHRGDR